MDNLKQVLNSAAAVFFPVSLMLSFAGLCLFYSPTVVLTVALTAAGVAATVEAVASARESLQLACTD